MAIHSNDKTPIITRDNYEEYFLMYVDDELTPQEKSMVEAFVQFNPELQYELDLLMGAKLEPEVLSFGNMDSLLASSMSNNVIDEALLLHVDNELNEAEKRNVEQRLGQDNTYNQQFQWLLRTKSDPAEVVLCPNKEALYRHTVRRIGFAPALRIAAAVLLIGSMGLVWWMQDDGKTAAPAMATNNVEVKKPSTATTKASSETAKSREQQPTPGAAPVNKTEINPAPEAAQLAQASKKMEVQSNRSMAKKTTVQQVTLPEPATTPDYIIALNEPVVQPQRNNNHLPVQAQAVPQKDIAAAVTSPNVETYNTTNTVAQPSFASADDGGDRGNKGNLKSLLRKATRLVERRTGIDATNEDDELIIGAVAIKLK